jgi:hypothetical protein
MLEKINKFVEGLKENYNKYLLLLKLFISNFRDSQFFDMYVRETFRTFFKRLGYYTRLLGFDWGTFFLFYIKIKPYIPFFLFKILWKYILVFAFVIWIIFNSLIFRFYLIDTPMDAKIPQERKEFETTTTWRRYIPVALFESMFFIVRPFWKVFGNVRLVFSNIAALRFLFYILLENDFIPFFKSVQINFINFFYPLFLVLIELLKSVLTFFVKLIGYLSYKVYYLCKNVFFFMFLILFNFPCRFFFGIIDFFFLGFLKFFLLSRIFALPIVLICVYLDFKGKDEIGERLLEVIYKFLIYKIERDLLLRKLLLWYNNIFNSFIFKFIRFFFNILIVLLLLLFYIIMIISLLV